MLEPRGGARLLLGVYLLFIVYGSFFPFDLTTDREAIRENLDRAALTFRDAEGRRNVSLPDLAGNTLLGVPLGFLLVVGGLAGSSGRRRAVAGGLVGLGVALGVEAGQVFAPGRVASIFDVAGQTAGTLAGALLAHGALEAGAGGLSAHVLPLLRARPLLGPLAALLAVLAADALYPYAVTLDVSTVWGNVKDAAWWPLARLRAQPWHALVVDRLLPYAAVTLLTLEALLPRGALPARVALCALPVAFAAGLEVAKLFVEGRSLVAGHVVLAAAGALLALAVAPRLGPLGQRRGRRVLAAAALALVASHQLRPFDFTAGAAAFRAKVARIEWAPFASYLLAAPQTAMFDTGKKLVLGALLGIVLHVPGRHAAVWWTLLLAAVLESAQLAQRSHQTALTDVLLLTAGAWLGDLLLKRYRAVLDSPAP
jgi:VanZ family protein